MLHSREVGASTSCAASAGFFPNTVEDNTMKFAIAWLLCGAAIVSLPRAGAAGWVSLTPECYSVVSQDAGGNQTLDCLNPCEASCESRTVSSGSEEYVYCACSSSEGPEPECCHMVLIIHSGPPHYGDEGHCNDDCGAGGNCRVGFVGTQGGVGIYTASCPL